MVDKAAWEFLLYIDSTAKENGTEWVGPVGSREYSLALREKLLFMGYVEQRVGANGNQEYRVTDDGRKVLIDPPEFTDGASRPKQTAVKSAVPEKPVCSTTCENCVYRQALALVAARIPEVADLVRSLEQINQLGR